MQKVSKPAAAGKVFVDRGLWDPDGSEPTAAGLELLRPRGQRSGRPCVCGMLAAAQRPCESCLTRGTVKP